MTIEVNCVSRLALLDPGAVHTRTTTSAGMQNVFTGDEETDKNIVLKRKQRTNKTVERTENFFPFRRRAQLMHGG